MGLRECRLCDENIKRYSELDAQTKAQGGKLLQIFSASPKYNQSPTLLAGGQFLFDAGFNYGEKLVAKYTHGHIRVRKLSARIKRVSISSTRDNHTGKLTPKLRLSGDWLISFGFLPDSPLTISSNPGVITLQLWNDGADKYRELVRLARQNQMRIIQVKECVTRGRSYPCILTTGSPVEKAGFIVGEPLVATCEQGIIKLQRAELAEFGF